MMRACRKEQGMDTVTIDQILDEHQGAPDLLIQVLLAIQSKCNWLPKEFLDRVGERLQVPMSRIQHIATFYRAFSLVPKGKHVIRICKGTACHIRGAGLIQEQVENHLKIRAGETTPDLKFSLEIVACVGACAMAPVVIVNDNYHGGVHVSSVKKLMKVK